MSSLSYGERAALAEQHMGCPNTSSTALFGGATSVDTMAVISQDREPASCRATGEGLTIVHDRVGFDAWQGACANWLEMYDAAYEDAWGRLPHQAGYGQPPAQSERAA